MTSTINDVMQQYVDAAAHNAQLLCKGISPDPNTAYTDISKFPGSLIFEKDAMEQYVRENVIAGTIYRSENTSGSNIEEYVEKFSNSFSAQGDLTFSPASSLSASVATEFNCSSESFKSVSFSQERLVAKFADIVLPNAYVRDNLRALVKPHMLTAIDKIASQDEADKLVAAFGAVYINTAQLGAILTISTTSDKTNYSSEQDLSAATGAEMNYLTSKVSAENKYSVGNIHAKTDETMSIEVSAHGGDPALMLKGDLDGWTDSSWKQPFVIDYRLAPISNLAKKGSNAEELIMKAVQKVCVKQKGSISVIEDPTLNGTYSIRSVDNGDGLYLNIDSSQQHNGGKIHQWAFAQKWILKHTNSDGEPIITLQSAESKLYLNIDIGQKRNGGKIHQWDYAQTWKLEKKGEAPDGSQLYAIRSLESSLYLNVDIGAKTNGGKIHQWNYPQTWKLV